MKPEPLKDKEWYLYHVYNEAEHQRRVKRKLSRACIKGFQTVDVASAVAWLKEQINPKYRGVVHRQIDKAFPDVTPISEGRKEGK